MLCSSSQSLRQLIFSHSTLLVGGSQFFSKSHTFGLHRPFLRWKCLTVQSWGSLPFTDSSSKITTDDCTTLKKLHFPSLSHHHSLSVHPELNRRPHGSHLRGLATHLHVNIWHLDNYWVDGLSNTLDLNLGSLLFLPDGDVNSTQKMGPLTSWRKRVIDPKVIIL